MKKPTIDDLILLSQDEAIEKHFDYKNFNALQRFLQFWSLILFVIFIVMISMGNYPQTMIAAFHGVLIFLFLRYGDRVTERTDFREFSIYFLLFNVILTTFYDSEIQISETGVLLAIVMLWFRFRKREYVWLLGILWVASAVDLLLRSALSFHYMELLSLVIVTGLMLMSYFVSTHITDKQTERFLEEWEKEYDRNKDRLRMKQELEHAHEIQTSMLPQTEPKLAGLDVASLSLPATEVGGDYYDYFQLSESRLAIAAGDVSGHGVASGLVLSGVRSCLYLLQEEPLHPVEIMTKLNRMTKRTTDRRMFVTFLYAVFDVHRRELQLSNAGHPAVIHFSAETEQLSEIQMKHLPLGALLDTEYEERTIPFKPNDVFVIYSDGLSEVMNAQQEEYGEQRLKSRLADVAQNGTSAKNIRDDILSAVWNFKGDQEQADDITMVVVKIG